MHSVSIPNLTVTTTDGYCYARAVYTRGLVGKRSKAVYNTSMVTVAPLYHLAYFAEMLATIRQSKPGDRLGLTTMNFDPIGPTIADIMQALAAAASRGVVVYMLVDAHAFMVDYHEHSTGPLLKHGNIASLRAAKEFRIKYQCLDTLAQAGGHYQVINTPSANIRLAVAGRSHIKTFIYNDTFYVGGCNLGRSSQIDCMVRLTDHLTADWLWKLLVNTTATGRMRQTLHDTDQQLQIDPQTSLFIDAGKPNQSLILEQAIQLIDSAEEYIYMTCQYFPNSITASHLARAYNRGVKTEVYYNGADKQTKLFGMIQQAVMVGEKIRLPKELFSHELPATTERLHAKVIATDKGAIIGSHNYVTLGVRLGTAEIALVRRDRQFSEQLKATLQPYLDST
jgi:phosphatidylserine/phosphatidylglycerophosphate/cardiolipin synthase-like enzyme